MATGEDLEKSVQKTTRLEGDGAALCRQSHDEMPKLMQSRKIAQDFVSEGGRSGQTKEYGRLALGDGQPDPRHDQIKQIASSGDYGKAAEQVRQDLHAIETGNGTPAHKLEAQRQYMSGLTNELGTGFVWNAAKKELVYDLSRAGGPAGSEIHIDISNTVLADKYSNQALLDRSDKSKEVSVKKDASQDKPDAARDGETVRNLYFSKHYEQAAQLIEKRLKQIENGLGTPQQKAQAESDYAYQTLMNAGFTDLQLGHGFHIGPNAKQGIIHFAGTALGDTLSGRAPQDHAIAQKQIQPATDLLPATQTAKLDQVSTTPGDSTAQPQQQMVKAPMPSDKQNKDSVLAAVEQIQSGHITAGVSEVNKHLMQIEHAGGTPEQKKDAQWSYIKKVCEDGRINIPTIRGDFYVGNSAIQDHLVKLAGTSLGDALSGSPFIDRTQLVTPEQLAKNNAASQHTTDQPATGQAPVTYEAGKYLQGRAEDQNKLNNPGGDPLKTGAEYNKAYSDAIKNPPREFTESTETVAWDNWRFGIQKELTDSMRPYISQYLNNQSGAVSFNFDVDRNGQIYNIQAQGNPRNQALEVACRNAVLAMARSNLLKFPPSSQLQHQHFGWPLYYGNIPEGTGYQRGQNETIRRRQEQY